MNTAKLKKYAPQARREFMSAVSKQLNQLGIYSHNQIAPIKDEGSIILIEGKTFAAKIKSARARLVSKVQAVGCNQLVEQVAYTWFNRLCAIRYMEIHEYFDHGFRVLSHPTKPNGFEILDHAQDAADELGLNREAVIQLKLAGNKDEELYRELLLGQCHKLHEAMPFLFEALDDETELLLPDNLTRTDSILRGLVDGIPDEDWQQVEVIGWLYQFYISEKKDQVMGKVVKSEDIPAATQLFTPNWIVKYLVQNSVGRQWLQTYPNSAIKSQMEYYIEPAEQSDEVIQQLRAITPESIDPQAIKVLDPACGSGHILIEAYNILKAIYEERGFRSRDIPKLILENNLYGLDIDDRAAQLSGFALMMMARNDDKRIFTRYVRLNVLSLQESKHIDLPTLWKALNLSGSWQSGTSQGLFADEEQDLGSFNADNRYQLLKRTLARFTQAKTFGSLIDVPSDEHEQLRELLSTLIALQESGDSMQKPAATLLIEFIHQALVLSTRYDAVVANPPYMGSNGMNAELKTFAKDYYPNSKSDLFAIFMERAFSLICKNGFNAQINMQSWMFLSSYEGLRVSLLDSKTIVSMAHLGARAFSQISGEVVQTTAWVFRNKDIPEYRAKFYRLVEGGEEFKKNSLNSRQFEYSNLVQADFQSIPGYPIAYWVSERIKNTFNNPNIGELTVSDGQTKTGDNDKYLRFHWEVSADSLGFQKKWVKHPKGGTFRRWYGNVETVIDWSQEARTHYRKDRVARILPDYLWWRKGFCWTLITSGKQSFRLVSSDEIFNLAAPTLFPKKDDDLGYLLGLVNTPITDYITKLMNPTINMNVGDIQNIPVVGVDKAHVESVVNEIIQISKSDWDSYETSFDFKCNPLIENERLNSYSRLSDSVREWNLKCKENIDKMKLLEEDNNLTFIKAYGLENELLPTIDIEEVTLSCNPYYRYGEKLSDCERDKRLLTDTITDLFSFSIGCAMGRYSIERDGLILASQSETFEHYLNRVPSGKFIPDADGIIPFTEQEWFSDDATQSFRSLLKCVWGEEHLQENLDFVAESLCLNAIKPKKTESALETIRRYLSSQFYKDHLKTYKKRPIYWLFSSGKQKAFECLVYLHRYNEGTLSRMRTEYVTPLHGKYDAYAQRLQQQIDSSDLTSEKNQLKKELDAVIKKQVELREFDDKLKHFADMRISLDLDDGVKVNYGKFGDLLADVKAITGSAED